MAPPKFADLGKAARDLFSKNFHFGVVNVEANTTAANGVKFTTKGKHTTATGGIGGNVECEMNLPYGLKYKESWGVDNVVNSTLTCDGQIAPGVKVEGDFSFAPDSGKMGGTVKTAYANCDYLHATADIDCTGQVHMSSVFGNIPVLPGWVVGCQA